MFLSVIFLKSAASASRGRASSCFGQRDSRGSPAAIRTCRTLKHHRNIGLDRLINNITPYDFWAFFLDQQPQDPGGGEPPPPEIAGLGPPPGGGPAVLPEGESQEGLGFRGIDWAPDQRQIRQNLYGVRLRVCCEIMFFLGCIHLGILKKKKTH